MNAAIVTSVADTMSQPNAIAYSSAELPNILVPPDQTRQQMQPNTP